MLLIALTFFTAFLASNQIVPVLIRLAKEKRLFDLPDERKVHLTPTPSLGGVAIFISFILAFTLWGDFTELVLYKYVFLAYFMFFFIGLIDDLIEIKAWKRFVLELIAAFQIAYGGLRITHLHGLFGLEELTLLSQYVLTIIAIVGIINAYNLIDGVDGLAGGIGMIISLVLGTGFLLMDMLVFAMIAFALAGGLIGFLRYNFSPAKIFMGDSGSLSIGLILVVLGIQMIEASSAFSGISNINSAIPVLIFALLMIPIGDTSQVFTIRISQGNSPFHPDRNHLHHLLQQLGLNHKQVCCSLFGFTLFNVIIIISGMMLGISHGFTFLFILFNLITAILSLRYLVKKEVRIPQFTSNIISPKNNKGTMFRKLTMTFNHFFL